MKRSLNRARSGLAVLIAIACALAIVASSASAAETHEFRGEFNAPTLVEAGGLAVDDATGDVFVADQTTGEVLRYDANGSPSEVNGSGSNFFGAFAFSNGISGHPGGQVAVDNSSGAKSGTVYVATEQGVRAFTAEGEEVAFTGGGTDAEGNLLKSFEENPMAASSVAVDSEGDIYVFALSGVDIFDANGKALTSFQSENPNGIAVAPSGRLYPSSDFIERAVPGRVSIQIPETYPPQSASSYSFALGVGSSYGDAVDPRSEDVLVASANSVREYEPTGENASPGLALVSTFGEAELGAGSNGVAVNGTNGDVYVASGTHVVHYGPLVKAPNVVTGAATNVNSVTRTATLNGTVDPLGEAITECKFEYGPHHCLR